MSVLKIIFFSHNTFNKIDVLLPVKNVLLLVLIKNDLNIRYAGILTSIIKWMWWSVAEIKAEREA